METEFVLDLLVQKKMSNSRVRQNESLVGGGETGGLENAAADSARGFTRSGVSYAAPNVSDSRRPTKKTVRSTSERKTCTETDRMVHGSSSQFLGTSSSSRINSHTARRVSGAIYLEYMNNARKRVQSPKKGQKLVQTE